MKLVLIKWRDSQSYMDTAWFGKADIKGKPGLIHSIGYLVENTKDHVCLVADWDKANEDQLGRHISIPRGCIVEMQTLVKGK